MKHRVGFNRLGRKPAHRKALHRNMVTSLFRHERIRTTKTKAQAIRRTAEKMITRAKVDSVHNRRMVARDIKDKLIISKLFVEIAPRFKERPGGYTRILKVGFRRGDAAEMVLLELLAADEGAAKPEKKPRKQSRKTAEAAGGKENTSGTRAKTGERRSRSSAKKDETVTAVEPEAQDEPDAPRTDEKSEERPEPETKSE